MQVNKTIYILGDVHGEWEALYRKIKHLELSDCTLICIGDLGIGFTKRPKETRLHEIINRFMKKRNIDFLSIRGNHDDPSYFLGQYEYSNFKLLKDYTYLTLGNDERFLFVGGAISVDRSKPWRREGSTYWSDEGFNWKPNLVWNCDVLITHSAPPWNGPVDKSGIAEYLKDDPKLYEECMVERHQHDYLIRASQPKKHYCGHFHQYSNSIGRDCESTILDILDIIEHRQNK